MVLLAPPSPSSAPSSSTAVAPPAAVPRRVPNGLALVSWEACASFEPPAAPADGYDVDGPDVDWHAAGAGDDEICCRCGWLLDEHAPERSG